MRTMDQRFNEFKTIFEEYIEGINLKPIGDSSYQSVTQFLYKKLSPYFTDQCALETFVKYVPYQNILQLDSISSHNWAIQILLQSLDVHRKAKNINLEESIKASIDWLPNIYASASLTWSWDQLDIENDSLDNNVREYFGMIGDLTEGLIKTLLGELLHQIRVIEGKQISIDEIKKLKFGAIVTELIDKVSFGHLLKIPPLNLRISDWRNIEGHKNWRVDSNLIHCNYSTGSGKNRKTNNITLTLLELNDVFERLRNIAIALNLSHRFYFLDNKHEIVRLGLKAPPVKQRRIMKASNFMALLNALQFDLNKYTEEQSSVELVIQDRTKLSPYERKFQLIEISQLVWQYTKAENISIMFYTKNLRPYVYLEIDGNLMAKEQNREVNPGTWLEEAKILSFKPNNLIVRLLEFALLEVRRFRVFLRKIQKYNQHNK